MRVEETYKKAGISQKFVSTLNRLQDRVMEVASFYDDMQLFSNALTYSQNKDFNSMLLCSNGSDIYIVAFKLAARLRLEGIQVEVDKIENDSSRLFVFDNDIRLQVDVVCEKNNVMLNEVKYPV